jgi:hypothetical protein
MTTGTRNKKNHLLHSDLGASGIITMQIPPTTSRQSGNNNNNYRKTLFINMAH